MIAAEECKLGSNLRCYGAFSGVLRPAAPYQLHNPWSAKIASNGCIVSTVRLLGSFDRRAATCAAVARCWVSCAQQDTVS